MVTQFPQLGKVSQCPPPPPLSQNQLWDQSSFYTQSNQNRLNQGRAPVYPQWVPSTLLGAVQQSSRGLPTTWSKGSLGQAKENPPPPKNALQCKLDPMHKVEESCLWRCSAMVKASVDQVSPPIRWCWDQIRSVSRWNKEIQQNISLPELWQHKSPPKTTKRSWIKSRNMTANDELEYCY